MRPDIVKLASDDWTVFRDIRLESLERAPEVFGTGLHQEIDQPEAWWRGRLESADVGVHAARLDGEAVGMAGWLLPGGANARHRSYVWGVYVRDGLRRNGVGRALLTATLVDALNRSEAVDLNVLVENSAAIRLYQSLGFTVVVTVPRALKYAGVYRDQHQMALDPAVQSTPGTTQFPVV